MLGALALTGAAALLLGACATGLDPGAPSTATRQPGSTPPLTHYTPAPAALQDRVDCLAPSQWRPGTDGTSPAPALMGSVPAGFTPVEVVRCRRESSQSPDSSGKVGWILVQEQLTGSYTELLAALAQPSDRQVGIACTADVEILPGLWLVNAAGQAIHVAWPLDACNKARGKPDTAKALAGLTVASTTKVPAPEPGP